MAKEKSRAEATANSITQEQYTKLRRTMQADSHVLKLFDYLWWHDHITSIECFSVLKNTRISSTVSLLRHTYGVPIKTEMVEANGKRFGVYSMDKIIKEERA